MSAEDLGLLDAACGNRGNEPARGLMNAFGVFTAREIIENIRSSPMEVRGELEEYVRAALDIERHKVQREQLRRAR